MNLSLINLKEKIEKKMTPAQHRRLLHFIITQINPNIPRIECNIGDSHYTDINFSALNTAELQKITTYINSLNVK